MTRYLAAFTLGSICGLYLWAWLTERIFPGEPARVSRAIPTTPTVHL